MLQESFDKLAADAARKTIYRFAILASARDKHSFGGKIRKLPPERAISHDLLAVFGALVYY